MYITNFIHTQENDSWLIGGDFNELLLASEKFRENSINNDMATIFRDYLNHYNLIDLGFRGSKFTWSNMRYKHRQNLILERLDNA